MIKPTPRIWYSVVTAVLLGVGGLASALPAQGSAAAPTSQQASTPKPDRAAFTKALAADLRKSGFQVNPGYPVLYPGADSCTKYTYPILKNCFGNNPAAPYVFPVVKSWPNEYVNPATVNAWGPTRPGYSTTYRLGAREAIVIYGTMPPPGKYMGLSTLEFSQHGHWKAKDYSKWANTPNRPIPMQYLFNTIPPNDRRAGRVISMSTLGDILNNVVMQRQSGYAFGKERYFIITPSDTTSQAVRRVLQAQGAPGGDIFTQQIPSRDADGPIGPLGMGKNAIDFLSTFRYAVPDPGYEQAAQQWRSQLPLTVLRVRAPSSLGPVQRYGTAIYEKQTTPHPEAYLKGDMQDLVNAVCQRTSSILGLKSADCTQPPPASTLMPEASSYGWYGPYCRKISMDCMGDNHDTAAFLSKPLPLDSGQVYAVAGTLATETGNATYVGLGVNDASLMAGPASGNVFGTALKGSADGYAATVHNTGKFFVHYYTRNCNTPKMEALVGKTRLQDCTSITEDMVPPQGSTKPGDPALHGMFMASVRDYIAPGTERAPDPSKLLAPVILTFTKP